MLRLGVILDSDKVPTWISILIDELRLNESVNLVCAIRIGWQKSGSKSIALRALYQFDNLVWPRKTNLIEKVQLQLPSDVPLLKLQTTTTESKVSFSDEALAAIDNYQPDLLLYFGSAGFSGKILSAAKHGIWTLQFGEHNHLGKVFPGFWEWYYSAPHSEIILKQLPGDPEKVNTISRLKATTYSSSINRNESIILSKGIDTVKDAVLKLAIRGEHSMAGETGDELLQNTSFQRRGKMPGFWHCLLTFLKLLKGGLYRAFAKAFFIEQWAIFINQTDDNLPSLTFRKFTDITPPNDRIWADPFVVTSNDRHYVFLEEQMMKSSKAHISCMELGKDGTIISSNIILDKPYHLSYPFVFQHENTWYLVPESTANRTVDLYECTSFPIQWKHKRTLLSDISAVDSTILFHENRYWLFCSVQQRSSSSPNDYLYLYYTDDLLNGSWTPHQGNPVVSDPYSARPAGRIYASNTNLIRPSQICAPVYGYGISLNKIIELNEFRYKEVSIKTIIPNWHKNLKTVHTLNFNQDITITDGILKRFKFF